LSPEFIIHKHNSS